MWINQQFNDINPVSSVVFLQLIFNNTIYSNIDYTIMIRTLYACRFFHTTLGAHGVCHCFTILQSIKSCLFTYGDNVNQRFRHWAYWFRSIGYILVGFGIAYKAPKLEGLLKSISYGFLVVWFSAFWWWDDVDGFRCTCRNWVWYGFSLNWAALGYGSVTFLV